MESIRKKLLQDDEARAIFHKIIDYLRYITADDFAGTEDEASDLAFNQQLLALVNMYRKLEHSENDTKIGHWCARENENDVKGMDGWSIYWLSIQDVNIVAEADHDVVTNVELTLWASGKDDNTIQKAIKIWAETHFKGWSIESLKCVRR
jgi:hypothetical protein